jgi:hypothetical protein
MRFERDGRRPDGSTVKLGFSLAFANDKLAPEIHFATCQQYHPEDFWNPAFQNHANSFTAIVGVVVVAAAPARHLAFMQVLIGAKAGRASNVGFEILTPMRAFCKPSRSRPALPVSTPETPQ